MADEKDVSPAQGLEVARMANSKGISRKLFQRALDEGIISDLLEEILALDEPTEIRVGGRTYQLLKILRGEEERIPGTTIFARAKKILPEAGEEDGRHILAHQGEIPAILREEIYILLPGLRDPDDPDHIAFLRWYGGMWCKDGCWVNAPQVSRYGRFIRRKLAPAAK